MQPVKSKAAWPAAGVLLPVRKGAEYVEVRCIEVFQRTDLKARTAGRLVMLLRNIQSLSPPRPPEGAAAAMQPSSPPKTPKYHPDHAPPDTPSDRSDTSSSSSSSSSGGLEGVYHVMVDSTSRLGVLQYVFMLSRRLSRLPLSHSD
jgi:hypothetical protein